MPDEEKQRRDRLADALHELSGADAHGADDHIDDVRIEIPSHRPADPIQQLASQKQREQEEQQRPKPSQAPKPVLHAAHAPSGLDHIVDDDLVAVPAPSEEMLFSAAKRQSSSAAASRAIAAKKRSLGMQRTLIPILLTLALLLPAFGIWLRMRPEESELRAYGQRLLIYLLIGGAVFLALAIVNMLTVRSALRVDTNLRHS